MSAPAPSSSNDTTNPSLSADAPLDYDAIDAEFAAEHPDLYNAVMEFQAAEADAANEAAGREMVAAFDEGRDLSGENGKQAQCLATLRAVGLVGLAICNLPRPDPLVAGVLDLDTLAVIYGPPGCGKSFISLDMACVVATGGVWQGIKVEQRSVLYVVAEGAHGMGDRLAAWRAQFAEAPDMSHLHWLPMPVDLSDPDWAAALTRYAVELSVKFIVIDTLARSMPGSDENSSKDMGRVVDAADALKTRTGACILIVHHTGWAEGHARGSSALKAAMDTELEGKGGGGSITLKASKQRHHEGGQTWLLALEPREASCVVVYASEATDRLGASTMDLLATLVAGDDGTGLSSAAWRLSSEGSEATYYRRRAQLVERGLVVNVGTDTRPRYRPTDAGRAA